MSGSNGTGKIRAMFDRVAARYDLINRVATFGLDGGWRSSVAELVASPGATTVVDVCSGTGELTLAVARKVNARALVVGLDFSENMIRICRDRVSNHNGSVALTQAGADAMPIRDRSVDVACSAFALRNLEAVMDPFLAELLRILKPGGRAVLLETGRPALPLIRDLHRLYLSWILPLEGRLLSGVSGPYRYLSGSIQRFAEPEEYCDRLRAAGFSDASFRGLSMGIATIYTCSRPLAE
jgi:demethylmenaquinone methyltransferase/2-methoxy-6-polyprenyl-1,4-benzoquinol methylase